jgi:CheY-like chemotaxis protein/anti-sigma regulatory factor (Ser/Thr protein kinase)
MSPRSHDITHYRILIVDDDPMTRDLVAAILENNDWQLDCAADGPIALTMIQQHRYDAVVTDIHMPTMSGLTLLHHIRQIRPNLPVVVMTGDNTPGNVAGSLRETAFSYISKPFSPSALLETVTRALEDSFEGDDIRVLSALPTWISLQVRCKLSTADRLVGFLREMECGLKDDDRELIASAFRELLVNAIEHGGRLDPEKSVDLAYIRTERSMIYYVRDPGSGFSVKNLAHAAVSNSPTEPFAHIRERERLGLRPGGFGILLTRNFADELLYSEKGNEVILIKYLDRQHASSLAGG